MVRQFFSMLELVVVLAVMSAVALIAIPVAVKPNTKSMEAILRRTTNLIEAARTVAMREGSTTTVTVNFIERKISTSAQLKSKFKISMGGVDEPVTPSEVQLPDGFDIRPLNQRTAEVLPPVRGMKVSQTDDEIVFEFRSDGTGMMPEIEINAPNGDNAIVSVMPLTGRIHVVENKR